MLIASLELGLLVKINISNDCINCGFIIPTVGVREKVLGVTTVKIALLVEYFVLELPLADFEEIQLQVIHIT